MTLGFVNAASGCFSYYCLVWCHAVKLSKAETVEGHILRANKTRRTHVNLYLQSASRTKKFWDVQLFKFFLHFIWHGQWIYWIQQILQCNDVQTKVHLKMIAIKLSRSIIASTLASTEEIFRSNLHDCKPLPSNSMNSSATYSGKLDW